MSAVSAYDQPTKNIHTNYLSLDRTHKTSPLTIVQFQNSNICFNDILEMLGLNSTGHRPYLQRPLGTNIQLQVSRAVLDSSQIDIVCEFRIITHSVLEKFDLFSPYHSEVGLILVGEVNASVMWEVFIYYDILKKYTQIIEIC